LSSIERNFSPESSHWDQQRNRTYREGIDLVYYHEKSVDEVAHIVGVPAATVKTRMFYARNKIADLLKQSGVSAL
jgi:RNA polymerase sigma-70 factor (ECF subfamily)